MPAWKNGQEEEDLQRCNRSFFFSGQNKIKDVGAKMGTKAYSIVSGSFNLGLFLKVFRYKKQYAHIVTHMVT